MAHNWKEIFIPDSNIIYKSYIEMQCDFCKIYGFQDIISKMIYIYHWKNGLPEMELEFLINITCEEFIIKNIIE